MTMSEMGALSVAAGVPAGVGGRMKDGVFTGEVLGSRLLSAAAESAQHPQRSADQGQCNCAQAHLGQETAPGLAGFLFGFDLVGQAILLAGRLFTGLDSQSQLANASLIVQDSL